LNQNDCKNRGFILDNYPKTYNQCKMLFMEEIEDKNENDEVKIVNKLNKKLVPQTIAILNASNNEILYRIEGLDNDVSKKLEY